MAAEMPAIGKKGKSLPTKNNADFAEQNLGLMDTVKIDSKVGKLTAKNPKSGKELKDLIGPN